MAHQLQLGYVGNQARIFQGKLLGLPVIGLPHRSQTMVNLRVTLETPKEQKRQHFGTQVTSGIQTPLSVLTEQIDTLYSFNEFVDLKGRFHANTDDQSKSIRRSSKSKDQSPELPKQNMRLKHKNLMKREHAHSPKKFLSTQNHAQHLEKSISSEHKVNFTPKASLEKLKLVQKSQPNQK